MAQWHKLVRQLTTKPKLSKGVIKMKNRNDITGINDNNQNGGIEMKCTTTAMTSGMQGELTQLTWHGGRQGDLDGGTWHGYVSSDNDAKSRGAPSC